MHKNKKYCLILKKLNCETDFVAKNEKFLDLSSQLAISVTINANPSHKKVGSSNNFSSNNWKNLICESIRKKSIY
jgi:translation elongation factor EF-Ts